MNEERILAIINQRTALEKAALIARRTTTLIINIIILLMGWIGIILLQIYSIPI